MLVCALLSYCAVVLLCLSIVYDLLFRSCPGHVVALLSVHYVINCLIGLLVYNVCLLSMC